MASREKKYYTVEEAKQAIQRHCAAQERSHKQVYAKLLNYGMTPTVADDIMVELIGQGFLNESRFAIAFARGKSRINGWGARKIEHALRLNEVSEICINQALQNLDEDETQAKLIKLATKKFELLKGERLNIRKQKTIKYLMGRGFSYDEIDKALQIVLKE